MEIATLAAALGAHGLILRGGFRPRADAGVPPLDDGRPIRTLVMVGNAGPGMWRAFAASPEYQTAPDPLDRWSQRVLGELAAELGATALFPFGGPPYRPFVAWAKRAAPVRESPLGMLIPPEYGLWHAYRGALAFAERLDLPPRDDRPRPCDTCADKPCLSACPVDAFGSDGYDVPVCVAHISRPEGADCMELGCRARRACPVGTEFIYEPAHAAFHMAAFRRAQGEK